MLGRFAVRMRKWPSYPIHSKNERHYMTLFAFDIETLVLGDFFHKPYPILCVAESGPESDHILKGVDHHVSALEMELHLQRTMRHRDYVGFTSTSFDWWQIYKLANDSVLAQCQATVAFDIYLDILTRVGQAPGLSTLLAAANLGDKIDDGGNVKNLYQQGQFSQIYAYGLDDARKTLALAQTIVKQGGISWTLKDKTVVQCDVSALRPVYKIAEDWRANNKKALNGSSIKHNHRVENALGWLGL